MCVDKNKIDTWSDDTSVSVDPRNFFTVESCRQIFSDLRNFSVFDFDIEDSVDIVGWIDDASPDNDNSFSTHF